MKIGTFKEAVHSLVERYRKAVFGNRGVMIALWCQLALIIGMVCLCFVVRAQVTYLLWTDFWIFVIGLPVLTLALGICGVLPGTRRRGQDGYILIARFLTFLSWFSLAAPFIAFYLLHLVYSAAFTRTSGIWEWPVRHLTLTWHYALSVSAFVGALALFGDIRFKRRRLVWLPVAGLILGFFLYVMVSPSGGML